MRIILVAITTISPLIGFVSNAEARGSGRFLGSLLRAGVSAATHSSSKSYVLAKSYTPDALTVEQLSKCIKVAIRLDEDGSKIENKRAAVLARNAEVDASEAFVELQRSSLNRSSERSIKAFNLSVDRHNQLVAR